MLEKLNKCIRDMDSLNSLEKAAEDKQKVQAIENSFTSTVNDIVQQVDTANDIFNQINLVMSNTVQQHLKTNLETLIALVDEPMLDENKIRQIKGNLVSTRSSIVTEWQKYYESVPKKQISSLKTIKSIVPNKAKVEGTTQKITNGYSLNFGNRKNIFELKNALDDAQNILDSLNLNTSVRLFLLKVSEGNANLSDLNPDVTKWLNSNNIKEKFKISFAN